MTPRHPARYSRKIERALHDHLAAELARDVRRGRVLRIIDPFAGMGGTHHLAAEFGWAARTTGIEIQPEWAACHDRTICGDAVATLHQFSLSGERFDALVTSPCYGNRMADHQDAQERCSWCTDGKVFSVLAGQDVEAVCPKCAGTGHRTYVRNTYAHQLRAAGAEPVDSTLNAQTMQWGHAYKALHRSVWLAAHELLTPGALVLLNLKNHIRDGYVMPVVEWHLRTWLNFGYTLESATPITTTGLPYGANAKARTGYELVIALRKNTTPDKENTE